MAAALPMVFFVKRGGIKWKWIIALGLVFCVGVVSLLFIGIDLGMPPGLSSLVLQVQALFTLLLSAIILKDSPTPSQKFGITVAFVGMGILAFESDPTSLLGLIFILGSALAWAFSNILLKLAGKVNMFRLFIWMSLIPPIPRLILSAIFETGQLNSLSSINLSGIGAVIYTGWISTVFAFSIWGRLIKKYSANQVAPFTLLVPISGIISSVILLGESFNNKQIIASLFIFIGLIIIVLGKRIFDKINYE